MTIPCSDARLRLPEHLRAEAGEARCSKVGCVVVTLLDKATHRQTSR